MKDISRGIEPPSVKENEPEKTARRKRIKTKERRKVPKSCRKRNVQNVFHIHE